MATARSPPETALEVANVKGFHTSVLDYSFPQRFAQAFAAEVEAFGEIVRGKRKPWVVYVSASPYTGSVLPGCCQREMASCSAWQVLPRRQALRWLGVYALS